MGRDISSASPASRASTALATGGVLLHPYKYIPLDVQVLVGIPLQLVDPDHHLQLIETTEDLQIVQVEVGGKAPSQNTRNWLVDNESEIEEESLVL